MEVQFNYSRNIGDVRKWTPSRLIPTSPLPLVANAVKAHRPEWDYSLRDKTKLLELAERIQTKKSSTNSRANSNSVTKNDKLPFTPNKQSNFIITPSKPSQILQLSNYRSSPKIPEVTSLQKAGASFRRSKLYASFSPTKRSLQKLAKTDPTKTNIEHLVNYKVNPVSSLQVNIKPSDGSLDDGLTNHISQSPLIESDVPQQKTQSKIVKKVFKTGSDFPLGIQTGFKSSSDHIKLTVSVSHDSYLKKPISNESLTFQRIQNNSRSFPKFKTSCKTLFQPIPINFWSKDGFQKLEAPKIESSNLKKCKNDDILSSEMDKYEQSHSQVQNSSPETTSSEKSKDRPMTFDYAQRKAWIKMYKDMESTQPSVSIPIASDSLPPIANRRKSSRNLSITHLHLTDSSSQIPPIKSSPKSSTSLLQKFAHRIGNFLASPPTKDGEDGHRIRTTGSSPDILIGTDIFSKEKSIVDPSSGKIRKKLRNTRTRNDKCQSSDSGIQLEEDPEGSQYSGSQYHDSATSSSGAVSPISMKKLSLFEIPSHVEDEPEFSESRIENIREDTIETKLPSDHRLHRKSPSTAYYHSLPLKRREWRTKRLLDEKFSVRANVVRELLTTEQNYVKSLNDIVQGFLVPCRARSDLFSDKMIQSIFSNIEDLLKLHVKILGSLREVIDENDPSSALIGQLFFNWVDEFDLYSEYCYQNPMSMATVRQLSLNPDYVQFFEACRRLQLMDKLPLHGFLLRPIQRICQYHLQISELLKYTPGGHEDYEDVTFALEKMKKVATQVNDTQRKFDSLQEIVRLQSSIDGWQGDDLLPVSSIILRSGDLHRRYIGRKIKDTHLILLNNEVIFCRKDSSKKHLCFHFRVPLDSSVWVDIANDTNDEYFGGVDNSWRLWLPSESTWILLTATSLSDKEKWMNCFRKTQDRYDIDMSMADMAKLTVVTQMITTDTEVNNSGYQTLPRLRKPRKTTNSVSSSNKSDLDISIIDVGKLRKSAHFLQSQLPGFGSTTQPKSNSKFYC